MDRYARRACVRLLLVGFCLLALSAGTLFVARSVALFLEVHAFAGNEWLQPTGGPERVVREVMLGSRQEYWSRLTARLHDLCQTVGQPERYPPGEVYAVTDYARGSSRHKPSEEDRFVPESKTNSKINYGFGVMTCPDKYPGERYATERKVYEAAVGYGKSLYEDFRRIAPADSLRAPAQVVGLKSSSYALADVLDIEFIFVANKQSGSAAFYPAEAVFDPRNGSACAPEAGARASSDLPTGAEAPAPTLSLSPRTQDDAPSVEAAYDARTRPWFKASQSHPRRFTEFDPATRTGLTYGYTDYAELSGSVRTAWRDCTPDRADGYIAAVDLVLYGAEGAVGPSLISNFIQDVTSRGRREWTWYVFVGVLFGLLAWAPALLLATRRFPALSAAVVLGRHLPRRRNQFNFRRLSKDSYHPRVRRTGSATNLEKHASQQTARIGGSLGPVPVQLGGSRTIESSKESEHIEQTTEIRTIDIADWCVERWEAALFSGRDHLCRTCKQPRFVAYELEEYDRLELKHQGAVLPAMRSIAENRRPSELSVLGRRYLAEASSVGTNAEAELWVDEVQPRGQIAIPRLLQEMIETDLILHGRQHVVDTVALRKKIFPNSTVHAVLSGSHWARLLDAGHGDLLQYGRTVRRLLVVEHEERIRELARQWPQEFQAILRHCRGQFWYVLKSELEGDLVRNHSWDFSLVEREGPQPLLVVTDPFPYSTAGKAEGFAGFASWRQVDIEFHATLFDAVFSCKHDLWQLAHSWQAR